MTSIDPSLLAHVTGGAGTADQESCGSHVIGGAAAGLALGVSAAKGAVAKGVFGTLGAIGGGYTAYRVTPACQRAAAANR